ncbi:MAG: hypothetical protein JNL83_13865 [Myxococcales bacterium]|nr:hypothetical protein [Myxococcales bacterium]
MTRHRETRQDDHATDRQGSDAHGGESLPATQLVRQMLASGHADARAIAQIVAQNPRASHEIFMLLNQTVGHSFANQVLTFATSNDERPPGGLGTPRDIVRFDRAGEYREDRATIDGPPKTQAPDTFGEYREDRATIDQPHTEKQEAPWVGRARRFNRAHADNVRAFLDSTGTSCVDSQTGELDPNKVARWQADHGLAPDGRVGDQTVRAAVSDPSLAL